MIPELPFEILMRDVLEGIWYPYFATMGPIFPFLLGLSIGLAVAMRTANIAIASIATILFSFIVGYLYFGNVVYMAMLSATAVTLVFIIYRIVLS